MSTVLLLAGLKTDVSECHAVSSTSCPALPGPPPPPLYSRDVAAVLATSSPAPLPPALPQVSWESWEQGKFCNNWSNARSFKKQSTSAQHIRILCLDTVVFLVVICNIVCTVLALCICVPYHAMTVYCHAHDVLCLQHTRDRPVP